MNQNLLTLAFNLIADITCRERGCCTAQAFRSRPPLHHVRRSLKSGLFLILAMNSFDWSDGFHLLPENHTLIHHHLRFIIGVCADQFSLGVVNLYKVKLFFFFFIKTVAVIVFLLDIAFVVLS